MLFPCPTSLLSVVCILLHHHPSPSRPDRCFIFSQTYVALVTHSDEFWCKSQGHHSHSRSACLLYDYHKNYECRKMKIIERMPSYTSGKCRKHLLAILYEPSQVWEGRCLCWSLSLERETKSGTPAWSFLHDSCGSWIKPHHSLVSALTSWPQITPIVARLEVRQHPPRGHKRYRCCEMIKAVYSFMVYMGKGLYGEDWAINWWSG